MSTIHRSSIPAEAAPLAHALARLVGPAAAVAAAQCPDARTHRAAVAQVVARLRGGAAHAAPAVAAPPRRDTAEAVAP